MEKSITLWFNGFRVETHLLPESEACATLYCRGSKRFKMAVAVFHIETTFSPVL